MKIIILGAGLSGLSAGYKLTSNQSEVQIVEKDSQVGGLAKTIQFNDCLFDLGGHRFLTKNKEIESFVKKLLGNDLLSVQRKSKIYFKNKLIEYPLNPVNALISLGIIDSFKALTSFFIGKHVIKPSKNLKDKVVKAFGETLFKAYFEEYTEKVWGIPAEQISVDWADQRIENISLWKALRRDRKLKSLTSKFYYPQKGIGEIAKKLEKKITANGGGILTEREVVKINTGGCKIKSIEIKTGNKTEELDSDYFISTIPITKLVSVLDNVPEEVRETAFKLTYRSIIILFLQINKPFVTKDSWIYFHNKNIPFARLHEPKNWSNKMVKDKNTTSLVLEFFCSVDDAMWNENQTILLGKAIKSLESLNFLNKEDVINYKFIKIPYAYPIYTLFYKNDLQKINQYLKRFLNLQTIGRLGGFDYNFMDSAIESGIIAADKALQKEKIRI